MTEYGPTPTRTFEEQEAVTNALQSMGERWTAPRDYRTMTPERVLRQLDDVYSAVDHSGILIDRAELNRDYDKSVAYARAAFRIYDQPDLFGDPYDSVFAVPLRADGKSPQFASDTNAFFPLLKAENGISPAMQIRGVLGVPPSVIETNTQGSKPGERGATIFVPLFSSMIDDIPDVNERNEIGLEIMGKAAELTHIHLGAKVLGLGGTFPKISNFGTYFKWNQNYDMSGLVTTTGHGGTVHLILETVKALQQKELYKEKDVKIGVIGAAGSIGWSSIQGLSEIAGGFEVYTYDYRSSDLQLKLNDYDQKNNTVLHQVDSAEEVFRRSDIIIVAVTRPIDLSDVVDLQDKVIIDDSEPKALDETQVVRRGGKVINVVGKGEEFKPSIRDGLWTGGVDNPYNFGDQAGLYDGASWGCDIERAVISWAGAYKEAITKEVTMNNVRTIGRLCLEAGVSVAQPFQINTHAVHID